MRYASTKKLRAAQLWLLRDFKKRKEKIENELPVFMIIDIVGRK